MKKLDLFIVLLILSLLLALTSCDVLMGTDGRDGKAYLEVTISSSAEAWYGYVEGFPSGWSLNTSYELSDGSHDVAYALCYYAYYSSDYYYYLVNSYSLTNWAVRDVSPSSSLDMLIFYLNNNGPVFTNYITIEVNSGTAGGLFKDGTNGQDKYYSLYLAWDPQYTVISSNGVELEKTITTGEDNETIIQFKDEYRTFTLTLPEKSTASEIEPNAVIKTVQ